jgi:hypothetical protein
MKFWRQDNSYEIIFDVKICRNYYKGIIND